jgi:hypothetical protein
MSFSIFKFFVILIYQTSVICNNLKLVNSLFLSNNLGTLFMHVAMRRKSWMIEFDFSVLSLRPRARLKKKSILKELLKFYKPILSFCTLYILLLNHK